jgi:hypothetical protein
MLRSRFSIKRSQEIRIVFRLFDKWKLSWSAFLPFQLNLIQRFRQLKTYNYVENVKHVWTFHHRPKVVFRRFVIMGKLTYEISSIRKNMFEICVFLPTFLTKLKLACCDGSCAASHWRRPRHHARYLERKPTRAAMSGLVKVIKYMRLLQVLCMCKCHFRLFDRGCDAVKSAQSASAFHRGGNRLLVRKLNLCTMSLIYAVLVILVE